MVRVFQISVLIFTAVVLAGCNAAEKNEPIWKDIKIGDIAPSGGGRSSVAQPLKTMNFGIYVFDIPAENLSKLDNVWQILDKSRASRLLKFNDSKAFSANSFSIGFGQVQTWNKVADLLHSAGGRKAETASLLMPDGEAEDFVVTKLYSERNIWYFSGEGLVVGATIGPGTLVLRIRAEKIPGSRGVCKVDVQPVLSSRILSPAARLNLPTESDGSPFTRVGFELKMSPGDFFLLGPEKYVSDQVSLAGLFFDKPGRKPVVRMFLFVCIRVSD
jgi:hypothetical protein